MNYQMYDFEAMLAAIPEKRLSHTIGTRDTALMLAKRHFPNLDTAEIKAAAILHDITKHLTKEEHKSLFKKYNISRESQPLYTPRVFHQITGAEVAKRRFNVSDMAADAIRCHTTGKADMNPLEMVILFADYVEPNRKYAGCTELREYYESLYESKDSLSLEKAIIKSLDFTIGEILERGERIHHDTISARNSLITKINKAQKLDD